MPAIEIGAVIWLTGLPAAGKSVLAQGLATALRDKSQRVEILDGDEVRQNIWPELGFSAEDRDANVRRIAHIARLLARHHVTVVVAAVSPYRRARDAARRLNPRFVEVYVSTPLEECIRRDPKGLYARALSGAVQKFTGVTDAYECPLQPEVEIDMSRFTVSAAVEKILAHLESC